MNYDYDLFVIGGGSGGVRAARLAAGQYGVKTALAEADRYGGTCVIRGCVPKKLMVYASSIPEMISEARGYGWHIGEAQFEWGDFHQNLRAELDRLEGIYRNILKNAGVESFDQRARITGAHEVTLEDGRVTTARVILVAVGGHPVKPDIEGAELGITSDDLFHLEALPKSMLILGGGYIASEFAGVMNGLGVKTTQVYRGDQILRGFDRQVRDVVADQMRQRGVDLRTGVNAQKLERGDNGIIVHFTDGGTEVFETVLFATGRAPNTQGLGLENAGVQLGKKGEIVVNSLSATNVSSIYAVGDVTDRVNLTPVAIREGAAFVETVFGSTEQAVDHDLIPTAIFTQPEIGTIGLGEEEAAAQGPIDVYCASFRPMRSLFAGKNEPVLMKLVVDQRNQRVLGCHIVAPDAGEMIQLAAIAVKMGATKADFDRTVAVHPTMSEELVTMKEPTRST